MLTNEQKRMNSAASSNNTMNTNVGRTTNMKTSNAGAKTNRSVTANNNISGPPRPRVTIIGKRGMCNLFIPPAPAAANPFYTTKAVKRYPLKIPIPKYAPKIPIPTVIPPSMSKPNCNLELLTKKFINWIKESTDGEINIIEAAIQLSVTPKCITDMTNVLVGVGLIERKSKNIIKWKDRASPCIENNNNNMLEEMQNLKKELLRLKQEESTLDAWIAAFMDTFPTNNYYSYSSSDPPSNAMTSATATATVAVPIPRPLPASATTPTTITTDTSLLSTANTTVPATTTTTATSKNCYDNESMLYCTSKDIKSSLNNFWRYRPENAIDPLGIGVGGQVCSIVIRAPNGSLLETTPRPSIPLSTSTKTTTSSMKKNSASSSYTPPLSSSTLTAPTASTLPPHRDRNKVINNQYPYNLHISSNINIDSSVVFPSDNIRNFITINNNKVYPSSTNALAAATTSVMGHSRNIHYNTKENNNSNINNSGSSSSAMDYNTMKGKKRKTALSLHQQQQRQNTALLGPYVKPNKQPKPQSLLCSSSSPPSIDVYHLSYQYDLFSKEYVTKMGPSIIRPHAHPTTGTKMMSSSSNSQNCHMYNPPNSSANAATNRSLAKITQYDHPYHHVTHQNSHNFSLGAGFGGSAISTSNSIKTAISQKPTVANNPISGGIDAHSRSIGDSFSPMPESINTNEARTTLSHPGQNLHQNSEMLSTLSDFL